jgi:hypothetical protein
MNGGVEIELPRRDASDMFDGDADPFLTGSTSLEATERTKAQSGPHLYGGIESHQFDQNESEVWWHHQLQRLAVFLLVYVNVSTMSALALILQVF